MKRIVVCCDGTWNAPDTSRGGVPCPTNVVRVAEAVVTAAEGASQLTFYDPGVGTSGTRWRRAFDGATGAGLSRNVLRAYRYLIDNFEPGDQLFLFGFSRGAYTVRSLTGLIRGSGILQRGAVHKVDEAYALYRSRSNATHPRAREATLFRKTYAVSDITPIRFIGVWDTVGSLGNPLMLHGLINRRYRFHDTDLSTSVEHAYQALAIDEKRTHFRPTLWHRQTDAADRRLEQVWFAGVHSNVGGGYPRTGLSDHALAWLAARAAGCGLALSGLPADDAAASDDDPEESYSGTYRLLPPHHRPIDGEPTPVLESDGRYARGTGPTFQSVHPSVVKRWHARDDYRPPNLVDYFRRNPAVLG